MKTCTIEDCERNYYAKGYCGGHYKRFNLGLPLEGAFRTEHRPAKIVGEIALIPLGIGAKDGLAIVDSEDSHFDKYKWSLSGDGYPMTWISGKYVKLHHLVIGKPEKGKVTDHINRDKLDNRKGNLRSVAQKVNVRNAGMLNNNTSGHKGVVWDKRSKKWLAQGSFNGTTQYGGYHETIEEAVKARQKIEDNLT